MNSQYLNEYIELLERIFSVAYKLGYSLDDLAKSISYSAFFQKIEKSNRGFAPIINDSALIKTIFPDFNIDLEKIPIYKQCLWAAESYMRIQEATSYTFETLFLYIPISDMYNYYSLYHEMDFSQIIDRFNELNKNKSVLYLLIEKNKCSLTDISKCTGLSYETLSSLKNRRRDIKKVNAEAIINLANYFNVRVETLIETKLVF